ncbi:MAG: hypothetical protein M3N98_15515, partial [Actinomycetota bacterium]|nr:hypothetical protein [Actinomycetota bacterium]
MSVLRVLLDHPDRRVATRSRLFVVLGLAVVAVTILLATYGRNWAWTGFGRNETVWDWLQLLAQPLALIIVVIQVVSPPDPRRLAAGLALIAVGLAVLMVGGYALGWSWTGFGEYRLWDWLHLLVLPLMLVLLPVWLRAGAHLGRAVRWLLSSVGVVLLGAFVGGYAFGWPWTGCVGKTFR